MNELYIKKVREENESNPIICIREINQNIKNVFEGKPLTRPLRVLNQNCEFKKRYDIACDLKEGDLVRARRKEYMKEYYQKPEVKAKKKEYYQKPEVKARMKEYNQKRYQQKRRNCYHLNKKQTFKQFKQFNILQWKQKT